MVCSRDTPAAGDENPYSHVPTTVAFAYEPKLEARCRDRESGSVLLLCLHGGITSTSPPLTGNSRTIQWIFPPRIHDLDIGGQHVLGLPPTSRWCYRFLTCLQRKSRELTLSPGVFGNLISLCVPSAISYLFFESLHRQHI